MIYEYIADDVYAMYARVKSARSRQDFDVLKSVRLD